MSPLCIGGALDGLTLRALMIHRADPGAHPLDEVGWGRFETDLDQIITCDELQSTPGANLFSTIRNASRSRAGSWKEIKTLASGLLRLASSPIMG